ncbi:MAG: histidine--tRNA ligase [Planctomycetales bacterium]|nr:histidine--tRNA ligase [Planctomycetales bacterium]
MITPRLLKGFRDFLPESMIPREQLIDTARRVYRSYGFAPIDTPVLEHLDVLQGKGGEESDRLMYNFEDHGKRKVGMRFDLTVPLARFAAMHASELGTPFKRYHIAKVWRGENTHRGRYREFMQCDFDTIGTESAASDIETVLVVHDLMLAIGIENFQIRINNRKVLTGLLEKCGLADKSVQMLRALDKLSKIGRDKVAAEMVETAGATRQQADEVLKLTDLTGESDSVLSKIDALINGNETGSAGVERLREVIQSIGAVGVPTDRVVLDVSIARGLDYYTGTIVETFLNDLPGIGSVCSGGRYDDLTAVYTKQRLPGIGASLGLDRLLAAMEELKLIEKTATPAPVLVTFFDRAQLNSYLKIAATLRAAGIGAELFPEPKKLGQQLKYADKRGFRLAIIAGDQELDRSVCQVKVLKSGESQEVSISEPDALPLAIKQLL